MTDTTPQTPTATIRHQGILLEICDLGRAGFEVTATQARDGQLLTHSWRTHGPLDEAKRNACWVIDQLVAKHGGLSPAKDTAVSALVIAAGQAG